MSTEKKLLKKIDEEQDKRKKIHKDGDRNIEPNLLGVSKALDEYYILNKLKLYCEYLSYRKIVANQVCKYSKEDFLLLQECLKIVQKKYLNQYPLFKIFWEIKEIYEQSAIETSVDFYSILNQVEDISHNLELNETLEIFSHLSNFCINKINLGESQYLESLLLINCKMVSTVYQLGGDRVLAPGVFKNIIGNALRIKKIDFYNSIKLEGVEPNDKLTGFKEYTEWIEQFILVYTDSLAPKYQEVYGNYCRALLEFERQDFEKAHNLLQPLKRKRGIFINLNVKKLYIQTQFERCSNKKTRTDAINELEKSLEAYRKMISYESKKKQVNYQIDLHMEFYSFCQKIYNIYGKSFGVIYKDSTFKKQKKELIKEIKKSNSAYKNWFVDKINSLE